MNKVDLLIFVKEKAPLFVDMENQNILIQFGVKMPIETVSTKLTTASIKQILFYFFLVLLIFLFFSLGSRENSFQL